MLRKLSIVGLVGVLVLVAGGITMALGASRITQPETLVLTDTTLKQSFIDVGKPGGPPSPGDTFFFVDSLTDPTDGTRVGTIHGQCEFQIGAWFLCSAAAFINDRGQIFVAGVGPASEQQVTFDLPITGGTGEFDNVRGSIHLEPISNKKNTLTLNLIP